MFILVLDHVWEIRSLCDPISLMWYLTGLDVSLYLSSHAVIDWSFRKRGLHRCPKDTGLALSSLDTSSIRPKSRMEVNRTRFAPYLFGDIRDSTELSSDVPRANKEQMIRLGQFMALTFACKDHTPSRHPRRLSAREKFYQIIEISGNWDLFILWLS
jgi:hypothetical protein